MGKEIIKKPNKDCQYINHKILNLLLNGWIILGIEQAEIDENQKGLVIRLKNKYDKRVCLFIEQNKGSDELIMSIQNMA